ncbi:hypothetical protein [Flavobacterium soli]|uniref:hypothetical protein n=1 Tax=Flavobacterium soli TaxID=344881 RepID=UPI0004227216|nr:hypothetical protein [Flavobacterium soli]
MKTNLTVILSFIICFTLSAQNLEVKYLNRFVDTLHNYKLLHLFELKIENILNDNSHAFKILEAELEDSLSRKHKLDYFYSDWPYEGTDSILRISFVSKKEIKDVKSIKGKIKYFFPDYANNSIIMIDKLKEKRNTIIFQNNDLKIAMIDLSKLSILKQTSQKSYNTEVKRLIEINNLNSKLFKYFLDEHYKMFKGFINEFMLYAEDPKDILTSIDTSESENMLLGGTANAKNSKIKVFFSRVGRPFNSAKIFIENSVSVKEMSFECYFKNSKNL